MSKSHRLDHTPFLVPPGKKIDLADYDPAFTAGFQDKAAGKAAGGYLAPTVATPPTDLLPIDPNGRFVTTYRPGGKQTSPFELRAALNAFWIAVVSSVVPSPLAP